MHLPKPSRLSAVKAISVSMSVSVTPSNMCRSLWILPGFNMRINEKEINNSYMAYARGAVRAEQRGDYTTASTLWNKAATTTCNSHNLNWALYRKSHCSHAATKQWSNPNASQAV
uniref:ANR family transcriptional regulator n=1 Tax=Serratia proteamaculans TaxID=28151 RepID=UPI00300DFE4B